MARIRSGDTAPEMALRRELHRLGLRYRLHGAKLLGKPDLVFPRHKAVVFVHGCFWHRHRDCKTATTPKSNIDFWRSKFDRNVARDILVTQVLKGLGWRAFVAWECELQSTLRSRATAERIAILVRE